LTRLSVFLLTAAVLVLAALAGTLY